MAGVPCFGLPKVLVPPVGRAQRLLGFHCSTVDGHSGYCIDSHCVEGFDLALLLDAAGYDELLGGAGAKDGGYVDGEALHGAFGVDVGVEESGAGVFEPRDGFFRREVDGVLPTFDRDLAGLRVYAEYEGFFAKRLLEVFGEFQADEFVAAGFVGLGGTEEAGAVDDSFCAGFEECFAVCGGLEASSDLTWKSFADHLDEATVFALAHRGVEVDELNDGVLGETLDPVFKVVEGQL